MNVCTTDPGDLEMERYGEPIRRENSIGKCAFCDNDIYKEQDHYKIERYGVVICEDYDCVSGFMDAFKCSGEW